MYCYTALPLDLHVLGLPLAFILSQDQTLHCKCLVRSGLFLLTRSLMWSTFQWTQGHLLFSEWTISQRTLQDGANPVRVCSLVQACLDQGSFTTPCLGRDGKGKDLSLSPHRTVNIFFTASAH